MEIHDWTQTKLWSELRRGDDAESRAVTSLLTNSMPDIQAVLAQGGTAKTDFTLHDSGHAYRVAQRMIDVVPAKSFAASSCYEKALLLLSAYLHDIGMTPQRKIITAIHRYLLTGNAQQLPQAERRHLQEWLDDFRGGIVPPIADAQTTEAVLETADELVTYYARHRHNDWSEEWMRGHFGATKLGTYAGWLEDLVLLCRSHHYGYDELRSDNFKPRIVGANGAVVNLRYLAAVLRIADVLEFDPERTPAVVFKHRDVNAGSAIYWHKDHDISMRIDNGRVLVSARPPSARIHKAIEDTVAQIDDELALCRRLAEEFPFSACPFLSKPTGHEWILASKTHASIEPLRHAYEYINGAFRPNTSRILNLLSGIALYGNPLAAVRELLQNAMDAVREQIAYVRLRRNNPADEAHARELSRSHVISLRVEADEQGYWLICADSGVGMSKRIICDYLLVSGESHRHDLLELERRCQKSGFPLGRTGQFGIGVLSYFMVARRVEISSRRSYESGSAESHGWHFASDGIGSFGELKVDKRIEAGTTVRLLLRPSVLGGSPQDWVKELAQYLSKTLRRLPCRFELAADGLGLAPMALEPGWSSSIEDLREEIWAGVHARIPDEMKSDLPLELLPANVRAKRLEQMERWQEVGAAMKKALRCDVREGVLPDGAGSFRSRVVYFDLPGGPALRLLRPGGATGNELMRIGQGYSMHIPATLSTCWKGIDASIGALGHRVMHGPVYPTRSSQQPSNVALEIDWAANGGVSVDRQRLMLSSAGEDLLKHAVAQANEHLCDFAAATSTSRYHVLNSRVTDMPVATADVHWVMRPGPDQAIWQNIRFPAVDATVNIYRRTWKSSLLCQATEVCMVGCLPDYDEIRDDQYMGVAWHAKSVPPSRVLMFLDHYYYRLVPVWDRVEASTNGRLLAPFPPTANSILGAHFNHYSGRRDDAIVWNQNNPIVKAISDEAWDWCEATFDHGVDPLRHQAMILKSKAYACAWLADLISTQGMQVWQGLIERKPQFVTRVLKLALGAKSSNTRLLFWIDDLPDNCAHVVTSTSWQVERDLYVALGLRDSPDPKWLLIDPDAADSQSAQPTKKKRSARSTRKRPRRGR